LSTSTSKSQIPIIDQAIETAALMFGTDKSRGWLDMMCGALQAGANPPTRCKRFYAARPPGHLLLRNQVRSAMVGDTNYDHVQTGVRRRRGCTRGIMSSSVGVLLRNFLRFACRIRLLTAWRLRRLRWVLRCDCGDLSLGFTGFCRRRGRRKLFQLF
jgi:hypothetical protein